MEKGGGAAAKEGVGIDWVTDTYHAQYQIDSESEKAVDAYRAVARAIYDVLGAKTLLDIGCGAGPLLRAYEEISPFGRIAGVEGSRHALRDDLRIELHDLTTPLDLKWKGFDVVTCFDVAEHLPKEAAPTLVRSIVKHAGRWIVFGPAPEGQDGYYHINCVLGDTLVSGPAASSAMRSWYHGKIIRLMTASGNNLSITPNHPVLTSRGWKAAATLRKGDALVCRSGRKRAPVGKGGDQKQAEASIEDVFRLCSERFQPISSPVPPSAEDFHGDGAFYEKVDVVRAEGLLGGVTDLSFVKPCSKQALKVGSVRSFSHPGRGSFHLDLDSVRLRLAATAESFNGLCLDRIRRVNPAKLKTLACRPERDAAFGEPSDNSLVTQSVAAANIGRGYARGVEIEEIGDITSDASSFRLGSDLDSSIKENTLRSSNVGVGGAAHLVERDPAEIHLDEVVGVEDAEFRGHVYNLSTEQEWYFANNIITHNCQHPTWWVRLFEDNDYVKLRAGLSEALRTRIREDERHSFCWWVAKNLMVFEKDTTCTMRSMT